MPEDSKECKAKKLAAARKKLKEYQKRGTAAGANTVSSYTYADSYTNSGHVSSNISERSESELHLNVSTNDINHIESLNESESSALVAKNDLNYFSKEQKLEQTVSNKTDESVKPAFQNEDTFSEGSHNINAIQVLITEKSQLTTELNKFRTLCREKDLEVEELRVQHTNATKRVDDLTQRVVDLQKQIDQQKLYNAELQHKLAQARAHQEDDSSHINELQQQLTVRDERLKKIETEFKDKCNELELSQLRVRQLSDENNTTKDDRVETLTQTQFMYEQQIRDLQAMVQQLTEDKEQANTQYQTYVQQLNAQIQQSNERYNELNDEATKLQEREKQWVDHIQQLEKEIQKNISRQADIKEEKQKELSEKTLNEQLQTLQERINEFDSERYEFQLKIKSQEDYLNSLQCELKQKDAELEELKKHLENVTSDQPDKIKLLATMESDKVAASRALTQNVELKKQLDELELRFVQLTNDKADLMNRLDSEQYANREMHTNYAAMEERLKTIDERFKFKDEEMIRLSIENEKLKKKLESEEDGKGRHNCKHDHYDHEHDDHEHHNHYGKHQEYYDDHEENEESNEAHGKMHEHVHNYCHHKKDENQHTITEDKSNDQEPCQEATEENSANTTEFEATENSEVQTRANLVTTKPILMPNIATEEAVEKLEQRFTQLMTQCADLTEEKQRLEHLVIQLQSETETIGEYITLYQTQRRILKQREYEKAAQTAMLQAERKQMLERLTMLNNLVSNLGMGFPQNQHLKQQIKDALPQNFALDGTSQCSETTGHLTAKIKSPDLDSQYNQMPATDFKSDNSQQILHQIQDIITEFKEITNDLQTATHSVDHLNCCSGKIEVV